MAIKKNTHDNTHLDCSLSPNSLDYLKINKQPFAADILTETTFFSCPSLNKIIENLQHQAQFSDLVLIIEGPYGSGKTSLFRHLILHEIENTKSLPIQAEATDTIVQLQQKISEYLQDLGDANHLDDNLKSLQSFNQTPLVIIDNTHVLSDTTLQELLRYKDQLKHDHEINLKLILFANNGISNTLEKTTDLDSNQMYVQSMPAYTDKLTSDLITHKLRITGYTGNTLLNEAEFQVIDKNSDGTPLGIMHQASVIIEKNIIRALNPPSPLWIKGLVSIVALFIVALVVSVYFGLLDKQQFFPKTTQSAEPTQTIKGITLAPTDEPIITSTPEEITPTESTSSSVKSINDIEPDVLSVDEMNNKDNSAVVGNTDKVDATDKQTIPILTDTLTTTPLAIDTTATDTLPIKVPTQKSLPAVSLTTKPLTTKKPDKTESTSIEVIKETSTAPLHPALKQLTTMGIHDSNWLLKQKNTQWTLQLLGAREPETLLSFSRQYALGDKAAWYKTWLKGQAYYVLVYGNYSSREQARESIKQLPENLRSIKPWAKSIKSVQQLIK